MCDCPAVMVGFYLTWKRLFISNIYYISEYNIKIGKDISFKYYSQSIRRRKC